MPHTPERSVQLSGYPDVWVAKPGKTVRFYFDSDGEPFRMRLVELTGGTVNGSPLQTRTVLEAGSHDGISQYTQTGSSVLVDGAADALRSNGFTIGAWLWPTLPGNGRAQTIMSRADHRAEITLKLNGAGRLQLVFSSSSGSHDVTCSRPLGARTWYRVDAGFADVIGEAFVRYEPSDGSPDGETASRGIDGVIVRPGPRAPLLIGARRTPTDGRTRDHFEGKLESLQVRGDRGEMVAAWDFGVAPETNRIHDTGPTGLHGRAVNAPARLVTGHDWDGTEVDPRHAPAAYRAAHFHSDDLEDAAWQPSLDIRLPADVPSGVYAAELRSAGDRRWIPFFVAPHRPSSDIAVIAPTFTYLAYANFRISDRAAELAAQLRGLQAPQLSPEERYVLAHPELGMSLYDTHIDGSPNCYSSRLRPVLEMSPTYRYAFSGAPRHLSADLELIGWLNRKGHVHDVLTDECLHSTGSPLLAPYRVVITGSHPEYYTAPMRDALSAYIARGGRVMYLGGNGFYWVTATAAARPHLIEVRRGHSGTRTADSPAGEVHHSLTGEPGGLWRHRGREPQRLVGVGFSGLGYGNGAGYRQAPAARKGSYSFLLNGIAPEEEIGAFGPTGGAADDEFDHVAVACGTPSTTVVLATSKGNHRYGYHHAIEDVHQLASDVMQPDEVGADLAITEWQCGGITFAASSIGWINCLSHNDDDNNVSAVTENVLRAFQRTTSPFGVAATDFGYSPAMKKDSPDTSESDAGAAGADDDVQSDPAKGADGIDWSDEGGATPSGPADTGDETQ